MRTSGRTRQRLDNQDWVEQFRVLPFREAERAGTDLPYWRDWLEHEGRDDWWDAVDARPAVLGGAGRPALVMGGWYDLYASDTFTSWERIAPRGSRRGAPPGSSSGPWPHALCLSPVTGGVDFGTGSMLDLETLEQRWFDHWLRGVDNGVDREPPVKVFLMGANDWRDEPTWPLPRTEWQGWYLHSGGTANTVIGDGCALAPPPGRARTRRHVRLRPGLPRADARRRQLLPARDHPLGTVRPARRRDARDVLVLHQRAAGARPGGGRPDPRRAAMPRPTRRTPTGRRSWSTSGRAGTR